MTENNENQVSDETEEVSEVNENDHSEMDESIPSEEKPLEKIDEHWDKILRLQAEIEN